MKFSPLPASRNTFRCARRAPGFALIIALSLMSFLVLLLLSLSTLTNVEIQGARSTDVQKAAKANAVFALLTALGELQAHAGPDQRVTGTADLEDAAFLNATGTSRWTGVWKNNAAANSNAFSPSLLNWLVSGNEGENSLALSPGDITPGSDGTVVLVGSGSVNDTEHYVVAPLVDIQASGNEYKGRYAFWVGDEGVKSNVALTYGAAQRNSAASENSRFGQTGVTRIYGNQATGSGGRMVSTSGSGVQPQTPWNAYDLSNASFVDKLYSLGDLGNLGVIESTFDEVAKNRWHDITVVSQGLATDSRKGGLKTDLSLAFEMQDAAFEQSALLGNSTNGHIYLENNTYGPKWKLLRDYYRLYKDIQNPATAPRLQAKLVTPLPPEDPDAGIPFLFSLAGGDPMRNRQSASTTLSGTNLQTKVREAIFPEKVKLAPVVAEIKFLVSIDTVAITEAGVPVSNDGSGAMGDYNRQVRIIIDPVVKLWNPYNVALEVEAFTIRVGHLPLGFRWYVRNMGSSGGTSQYNYTDLAIPHSSGTSNEGFAPLNRLLEAVYGGTGFATNDHRLDSLVFTIPAKEDGVGIVLEPGQVKIFSCNYGSPLPLNPSLDLDKRTIGLKEGWQTDGGFVLEASYIARNGSQTVPHPVKAQREIPLSGGGMANSAFAVEMTTKPVPSGWDTFPIYTYLFEKGMGGAENRHNVKDSGADYFYNTAYLNLQSSSLPITGAPSADPTIARYPASGFTALPEPGDRQYLMSVEVRLKAEDESNVPLAQFSPTAYVHSVLENSINSSSLKASPAYTLTYRRINSDIDANVQYNATTAEGYYGASHGTAGQSRVPLLDVPQAPLFSIGQLQNADTSIYAVDPLLAIGNSPRSPVLNPNALAAQVNASHYGTISTRSRADNSYLLNRELWDSFFFSTIAPTDSDLFATARDLPAVLTDFTNNAIPLINPNFRPYRSASGTVAGTLLSGAEIAAQAPERSAAFLVQSGQFNINSTSIEAWKALLGSTLGEGVQYRDGNTGTQIGASATQAPFSRFALPQGGANDTARWKGFRSLSNTEVDKLAKAIVDEVRDHGPFLSLGQFVNRDLANAPESGGLLERAIATAELNDNFTRTVSVADLSFLPNTAARSAVAGKAALGAPQMLLPGDILSVLGQRFSARSDTFRIRAYGEVVDPITNQPQSTVWLEAIVQRVPDYVDSTQSPWQSPQGSNADFGRRFIIREIRFLSPDEV